MLPPGIASIYSRTVAETALSSVSRLKQTEYHLIKIVANFRLIILLEFYDQKSPSLTSNYNQVDKALEINAVYLVNVFLPRRQALQVGHSSTYAFLSLSGCWRWILEFDPGI